MTHKKNKLDPSLTGMGKRLGVQLMQHASELARGFMRSVDIARGATPVWKAGRTKKGKVKKLSVGAYFGYGGGPGQKSKREDARRMSFVNPKPSRWKKGK